MENLNFESLKSFVKSNRNKKVLITFHSIGDTDSVSAAAGLLKLFSDVTIATPDIITGNARRLMGKYGFRPENVINIFDNSVGLVVLVDVNNFGDCGSFKQKLEGFPGDILIIDHHAPKQIAKDNVYVFNNEGYNSAASIVYRLLDESNANMDMNTALMLLTGIVSDSADLRNSTPETFVQIGKLLQVAKVGYAELLEDMQHVAEAEARAKTFADIALSEMDIVSGLLFVHGKAHAHANIAADAAIKIGADVSLFYSLTEKEVSFSVRLRSPLDRRFGIHLGQIMRLVAPMIKGNGGGHPAAAGAYGSLEMESKHEEVEKKVIDEIVKRVAGRRL